VPRTGLDTQRIQRFVQLSDRELPVSIDVEPLECTLQIRAVSSARKLPDLLQHRHDNGLLPSQHRSTNGK
jgi:hypothetical protein